MHLPQSKSSDMMVLVEKAYTKFIIAILALTAAIKLISINQPVRYLESYDPLFTFLKIKYMLLSASIFELCVISCLIISRDRLKSQLIILWTSLIFGSYHVFLSMMNNPQPCRCLGGTFDWLGIPNSSAARWTPIILVLYMLVGSIFFLLSALAQQRKQLATTQEEICHGV